MVGTVAREREEGWGRTRPLIKSAFWSPSYTKKCTTRTALPPAATYSRAVNGRKAAWSAPLYLPMTFTTARTGPLCSTFTLSIFPRRLATFGAENPGSGSGPSWTCATSAPAVALGVPFTERDWTSVLPDVPSTAVKEPVLIVICEASWVTETGALGSSGSPGLMERLGSSALSAARACPDHLRLPSGQLRIQSVSTDAELFLAELAHYARGHDCSGTRFPLAVVAANAAYFPVSLPTHRAAVHGWERSPTVLSISPFAHGTPNAAPAGVVFGGGPATQCSIAPSSARGLFSVVLVIFPSSYA